MPYFIKNLLNFCNLSPRKIDSISLGITHIENKRVEHRGYTIANPLSQ